MVHQWFDMTSVQRPWEDADMQREGLEESAEYVARVIEEEVEKVGEDRVIVGGISQGCALGAYVLVTRGFRVGGFLGLSGWWPGMVGEKENAGHVRDVPMLLQHCRDDDVVPVENGEELMRRLEERGMMVRWECFEEGKHWLNEPEGMDGIVRFIREVLEISKSVGRDVD
jgi:lysophospholipase-2